MPSKKPPRKRDDQPHDAVFKAFFSDAKIAKNYLLHYSTAAIHEHIDFTTFQKTDTAFVSSRFGISFSDVLYETRLTSGSAARLLFLFEHKSYVPSTPVHLQLLDYFLQIWEEDLKNGRRLSFIVPIVVYHGKRGWKQRPLYDYFQGLPDTWKAFVPNFNYLLTDLNKTTFQEIEEKVESEYLRNIFLALKFSHDEGLLLDYWPNILTFGEFSNQNDRIGILLQTLTLYIFNLYDMTEAQVKTLNKQLPEPERNLIDAIPEIFGKKYKEEGLRKGHEEGFIKGREEGREEGIEQGIEQGRGETTRAITIKMIQKFPNLSNAEIAELVGFTDEFVQDVRKELKNKH